MGYNRGDRVGQNMKYRNEWKYVCNEGELALLEARLKEVLVEDTYAGEEGKYTVISLYFDDYKDSCAKSNNGGDPERYKWRIRYYLDGPSKYIHLERKEKKYGMCYKESCPLTEEEVEIVVKDKDVMGLFWQTGKDLLRKFCMEINTRRFRPKVIVQYERYAYIEPIANIRVTLDTNIAAGYEFEDFLEGNYQLFPMQEQKKHVLEVKFDDIFPGYLKRMVEQFGLQQTAFSKYYLGRKKIEEILI